jgi:hypothetical protein
MSEVDGGSSTESGKQQRGRPRGPNFRFRNRGLTHGAKSIEAGDDCFRNCAYKPCQIMFFPKRGQVEQQRFCSEKCKVAAHRAQHPDPRGVKRPENQRQRLRRETLSLYEHVCVFCKQQKEETDLFVHIPAGYERDVIHAILVCRKCNGKNRNRSWLAYSSQVLEILTQRGSALRRNDAWGRSRDEQPEDIESASEDVGSD